MRHGTINAVPQNARMDNAAYYIITYLSPLGSIMLMGAADPIRPSVVVWIFHGVGVFDPESEQALVNADLPIGPRTRGLEGESSGLGGRLEGAGLGEVGGDVINSVA